MPRRTSQCSKLLNGSANAQNKITVRVAHVSAKPLNGLDRVARSEWLRVTRAFASTQRLCELDHSLLAMYCSAYSRWKRAEAALLEQGDVVLIDVRDTHGNVTHQKPIVNPLTKVLESAARQVHRYGESLGFSPASRTKQGVEAAPQDSQQKSAISKILKAVELRKNNAGT
jgi:P27 family predicted phage terminase small subunit